MNEINTITITGEQYFSFCKCNEQIFKIKLAILKNTKTEASTLKPSGYITSVCSWDLEAELKEILPEAFKAAEQASEAEYLAKQLEEEKDEEDQ